MDNRTIEKTATNVPETEPTKTDTAAAIPQANLAPGVGGSMMLMSRPGNLQVFFHKATSKADIETESKTYQYRIS